MLFFNFFYLVLFPFICRSCASCHTLKTEEEIYSLSSFHYNRCIRWFKQFFLSSCLQILLLFSHAFCIHSLYWTIYKSKGLTPEDDLLCKGKKDKGQQTCHYRPLYKKLIYYKRCNVKAYMGTKSVVKKCLTESNVSSVS